MVLAADARALFLLAMIMASSLGSIATIVARIKDAVEELSRRAEENHVVERLLDATLRYLIEVGGIMKDWLFTKNTTLPRIQRGKSEPGITSIVEHGVARIINKTLSRQVIRGFSAASREEVFIEPPYRSELKKGNMTSIEPHSYRIVVPVPR